MKKWHLSRISEAKGQGSDLFFDFEQTKLYLILLI